MTKQDIQARLQKAIENVAKVQKTIARHEARLEKLEAKLTGETIKTRAEWYEASEEYRLSEAGHKLYWLLCDIENCREDISRNIKKLSEKQLIVEGWEEKLAKAESEENEVDSLPENLKGLKDMLVKEWDAYDIRKREDIKQRYSEYKNSDKKMKDFGLTRTDINITMHETDEQIHVKNIKDAEAMILNLVYRVKEKCGDIITWEHMRVAYGNGFGAVLNGYVEGTKGKAVVESIDAGGYNIQRYHIRVLVK